MSVRGQDEDLTDVVELRVHGVHGTPPSVLLDDPFPTQVAGDRDARFYRRRESSGRPATGPTREAFWWSRLTSGSPTQALWLLFLPFALLNLARYMLLTWDDARDGEKPAKRRQPLDRLAGALLRLLGMGMTMGLLVTTVSVGAGMIVGQCLAADECLRTNSWLTPVATWPAGPALLLACVPPVAVIALFEIIGRRTNLRTPPTQRPTWVRERRFGNLEFWREAVESLVLRRLHLAGCLALVGTLYTGFAPDAPGGVVGRVAGLTLLGLTVVAVAATGLLVRSARTVATGLALLCAVYCTVAVALLVGRWWAVAPEGGAPWGGGRLPGLEEAANTLGAALFLSLLALVVVVAAQSVRWRRREAAHVGSAGRSGPRPVPFRPMWAGLGAAVTATLAVGLVGGFGTGVVFAIADLLGTVRAGGEGFRIAVEPLHWTAAQLAAAAVAVVALLALPLAAFVLGRVAAGVMWTATSLAAVAATLAYGTGATGAGQVLTGAGVLVLLGGVLVWARESRGPRASVTGPDVDYPVARDAPATDIADAGETALARTWRAWLLGRAKYRYAVVAGVLAALAGAAVAASGVTAGLRLLGTGPDVDDDGRVAAFGAAAMGLLLVLLVSLGVTTFRNRTVRTAVGITWDLISFWPRLVHPLCPPPYGGRAVIETATRVVDLAGGQRPPRAVVLSGHSQGSLICVSAVTLLVALDDRPSPPRDGTLGAASVGRAVALLGLLTYGSQLQWAFARLFPCFVGFRHLERLYQRGLDGRWRNLRRETDPLGGPVLSWSEASPVRHPDRQMQGAYLHTARQHDGFVTLPGAAARSGPDVRMRDPVQLVRSDAASDDVTVRGHGGYYEDRTTFEAVLREVVAEIRGWPAGVDRPGTAGVPDASRTMRTSVGPDGGEPETAAPEPVPSP